MYINQITDFIAGRIFKKIELSESIRYASGDPIESWLNGLLCLDAANYIPNIARLKSSEKKSSVGLFTGWPLSFPCNNWFYSLLNQAASSQRMWSLLR